jgi:hypothetical protein
MGLFLTQDTQTCNNIFFTGGRQVTVALAGFQFLHAAFKFTVIVLWPIRICFALSPCFLFVEYIALSIFEWLLEVLCGCFRMAARADKGETASVYICNKTVMLADILVHLAQLALVSETRKK